MMNIVAEVFTAFWSDGWYGLSGFLYSWSLVRQSNVQCTSISWNDI